MPEKAGSTLCPTQNTIMATKPTVSAWREAPQIPGGFVALAAQMPRAPATSSHTYALRRKYGKLGCTPCVLAGFSGRLKIPSALMVRNDASQTATIDRRNQPLRPKTTPASNVAVAIPSRRSDTPLVPRNVGSHLALKPHTNGTIKPQDANARKR